MSDKHGFKIPHGDVIIFTLWCVSSCCWVDASLTVPKLWSNYVCLFDETGDAASVIQ